MYVLIRGQKMYAKYREHGSLVLQESRCGLRGQRFHHHWQELCL